MGELAFPLLCWAVALSTAFVAVRRADSRIIRLGELVMSLTVTLGRAGPAPCPGSRVDLALIVRVSGEAESGRAYVLSSSDTSQVQT